MKKVILGLCIALCCVAVRGNAANAGSYGPVQAGETLFRIALKYQYKSVTMSQMMMSIFEASPNAFHRENINRLKIGETLNIPDLQTTASMNPDAAYREVTAQIETYEMQEHQLKAQGGELTALEQAAPEPLAGASLAAAISEPNQAQIDEIKVELAAEELQAAQPIALPEPKPAKGKRKSSPKAPLFRYSYDISYIDDDNVRLAQDNDDIRSDRSVSATVRARGGTSLDSFSILNYGGSATYNKMDTYDKLDNYEVEVNTRYRFALDSGFTAPIYTLGARVGGRDYDSKMRDATFVELTADMNKWITTTINMTTGVGLQGQESRSDVFDTSEARIFVNFDTNFSKADLVYTTFTYITGDTVSSGTPALGIVNVADEIEPDDAFGGIDSNQFAYRLDADTLVYTLGYNRVFTPDLSMDLSVRYVDSEAQDDDDINYDRTIFRASLLGRF
jgi:FimV-like protein